MEKRDCPHCPYGGVKIVKNGFAGKKQRYKCAKGHSFITTNNFIKAEEKRIAFILHLYGYSLRDIAQEVNASYITISNWLEPLKIQTEKIKSKEKVVVVFTKENIEMVREVPINAIVIDLSCLRLGPKYEPPA